MATPEPRVVLDTNVLISAGLSPHGTSRRVLDWVLAHGRLLLSAETLDELSSRFLLRTKFDRYASVASRTAFIASVAALAETVHVTTALRICADPDDDRIAELAVDGRADVLVTGNRRDFPDLINGVEVLTPAEFAGRYVRV